MEGSISDDLTNNGDQGSDVIPMGKAATTESGEVRMARSVVRSTVVINFWDERVTACLYAMFITPVTVPTVSLPSNLQRLVEFIRVLGNTWSLAVALCRPDKPTELLNVDP